MITMNHHPLHTDAWYAETQTQFGKNVVVGNLVYSLVLGMSVPDVSGAAIANLEVEELQHKTPTFHGDTIYAETKVLEKRESQSRPDRGVVTVETRGFNQRGEEVCYFRRKVMVPKRDAAAAAPAPLHVTRHRTGVARRWRRLRLLLDHRRGDVPAHIVLDTPDVVAFLDHRPLFPGHTLVDAARARRDPARPRRRRCATSSSPRCSAVAAAVQDAMGAQGSFVAMNNVVSQSVPHLHVHVVPRNRKDGLRGFFWPRRQVRRREDEAEAVAAAIRRLLAAATM